MNKYKIYFQMEGDVIVEADTEGEAREIFYDLDPGYLSGQTYCTCPQIDDIRFIGEE